MKKLIHRFLIAGSFLLFVFMLSCDYRPQMNQIVKMKGDYICVSLNNYFQEVNQLLQSGGKITDDLDSLFGISWLEGYVIDYENKDIILVGKSIKSRPTYHTEDLIVNFQNVFDSAISPYCSLDPIPENILNLNKCLNNQTDDFETTIKNCQQAIGGQRIVVGGVPRNSRHAKIMIYADYDMKKISQGLLKETGIRSCIDFSMMDTVEGLDKSEHGATMSRFWFHIMKDQRGHVYPNYIENEGIVFINECPVVLLTEKQIADEEGNLNDNADEEDKSAELFAAEFSTKFADLSNKSQIFAELENLFRIQAFYRVMKIKSAIEISGIDLNSISGFSLQPGVNDLPETLPGLINYKIIEKTTHDNEGSILHQQLYIVAGGVSQEMTVDESNLMYAELIKKSALVVLKARPQKESIQWVANLTASN